MKKALPEYKHKYIECVCWAYNHVLRLSYDEPVDLDDIQERVDLFDMEFAINKFPGRNKWFSYLPSTSLKNYIINKWTSICMKWNGILNYFTGIKWAICGKPLWYGACISFDVENTRQLANFLNERLAAFDNACNESRKDLNANSERQEEEKT